MVVLECRKGLMGVEKDTVSLGSTHKQPKFLENKGKTHKKDHNRPHRWDWPLDKILLLHKEKVAKGPMVPLSRSHSIWVPESKNMLEM